LRRPLAARGAVRRRLAAALAAVVAAGSSAAANPGPSDRVIVYRGATVIEGPDETPIRDVSIVTRGERIIQVEPDALAKIPPDATIVDVAGLYAAPGLINTHEHFATDPDRPLAEAMLKKDLYGGITAVRDMAGDARLLGVLKGASRSGALPAPDIDYAAVIAGPAFFDDPRPRAASRGFPPGAAPWARAISPDSDLALVVKAAKGAGVTAVKIYADLPADEVAALTREAHRQRLLVWAHAAVFPASPREVIEAGVDSVSHACMLAYQVSATMPTAYADRAGVDERRLATGTDPTMAALFQEMRRRGVILDATLRVYVEMARDAAEHPGGRPPYCSADLAERLTRQAYLAGVAISAGTDGFSDDADPWPALQDELELLQDKAGMSPADVLRSATAIGARAMGEPDIGSIEVGKLADVVFTRDNPLDDVRAFRTVVLTVKRGVDYWRKDDAPPPTRPR
jgi:imidazolonepropionase-like amidohydrolase